MSSSTATATAALAIAKAAAAKAPAPSAGAAARTRTTFGLRPRFVHVERPAAQISAVQCRNRPLRFAVIRHFHECEAPRATSLPVRHDANAVHRAIGFKEAPYRLFTNSKIEISYENILQVLSF